MRLLFILGLLFNGSIYSPIAFAKNDGETRTATVRKSLTKEMQISIKSEYTELTIESWNQPEAMIEATVRFDGKMNARVEKFLEEFQQEVESGIELSSTELKIDANLDEPNKVQIGSKQVGLLFGFSEDELKVSYRIKIPGDLPLEVKHSYKDFTMQGHFHSLQLQQYSGEFRAQSIGYANLNLKYGSARIEKIESADIQLYEEEMQIDQIGQVELNAKYSDLEFGIIDLIDVVSYETDMEFGTLGKIMGSCKYGDIQFTETVEEGQLELYEMDLEGERVNALTLTNSKYSKFDFQTVTTLIFEQSYEDEVEVEALGKLTSMNAKYCKYDISTLTESLEVNAYEAEFQIENITNSAQFFLLDGKYLKATIENTPENFTLSADTKYGKVQYDEDQVETRRFIKDSDKLELEIQSKALKANPTKISVKGYEVSFSIN